jgi:hypothetical protein
MVTLEHAIKDLRTILGQDPAAPDWRWQLRRQLSAVKEALSDSAATPSDGWLSARAGSTNRERHVLRSRVSAIAAAVLDRLDTDTIAHEVSRLERDLEHHLQRLHDLVYDSVALEIGGSE